MLDSTILHLGCYISSACASVHTLVYITAVLSHVGHGICKQCDLLLNVTFAQVKTKLCTPPPPFLQILWDQSNLYTYSKLDYYTLKVFIP